MNHKFSAGIWALGPCSDRFVTSGYKDKTSISKKFKMLSKVKDLQGVELLYPTQFPSLEKIKKLSKKYRLEIVGLIPLIYSSPKWKFGSIASPKKKIRRDAIKLIKETVDIAEKLNTLVIIWPGQDGFDYPFQVNYIKMYKNFTYGLKEICEYKPNVRIALEYKLSEPRSRILASNVGHCLTILNDVECENLGINIDIGHALIAHENIAQAAALASLKGKLFHTHLNDNFRRTDDDMILGSVHFCETLEFFYWLKRINYENWYSLDLFPYREDAVEAIEQSIENIKFMLGLVDKIKNKEKKLEDIFKTCDATRAVEFLRHFIK